MIIPIPVPFGHLCSSRSSFSPVWTLPLTQKHYDYVLLGILPDLAEPSPRVVERNLVGDVVEQQQR